MGFEDKPLLDEFVALYVGICGNKTLERQFREQLNVSLQSSETGLQTHFSLSIVWAQAFYKHLYDTAADNLDLSIKQNHNSV